MTDRDHYAAAAMTGLLANGDYGTESTPGRAWKMADAMLRERGNHIADAGKMVEKPTNHDAAPAARAACAGEMRDVSADSREKQGTGDTPAMHATPPQGIEPREGTEPVACAVMLTDAERDLLDTLRRSGYLLPHGVKIIDGLLERLGGGR